MPKPRRFISIPETVAINNILKNTLIHHDDNTFSYKPEWNDLRVAEMTVTSRPDLNAKHVASIRRQLFGKLRPTKKPPKILDADDTTKRLTIIEGQISRIIDLITDNHIHAHMLKHGKYPPIKPATLDDIKD